ncbi:hypothetical protein GIB67_024150 [Kingdonia uniflora]|uniref:Uncharacterized protein n=1 Tax=Kingdonia uniflora TaxID=39325 RepID=A0A7J7LZD4_9MAGN|nr:hypothetical protein GIB67_024150 [Kingdonia uniflora]
MYTMNEKVPLTTSNRRKRELAREGDLVTYKRKRKTIDPSTVVPPNTVDSANEGISEGVNILTESTEAILEVFENSLLQDLNAFNSLKAGGTGILLSLKKLKSHYAYKLEKVLSNGIAAAAKKKKGLTARYVTRTYMLYVVGSFLFPTKKGTDISARYLVLFAKNKVSWIFVHFPKLGGIPKEMDSDAFKHYTCWKWDVSVTDRYGSTALLNFREALDNYKLEDVVWDPYRDKRDSLHAFKEVNFFYGALANDSGIYQRKPASVNEHGDTPVHQSEDIAEQYDASLQKLKGDKEKEFEANINLREALKEKTSECDLLKETIEQMKAEIELKRVVDEQSVLEFADLSRQLDAKCKEIESLKMVNTILMEQIDMQLAPATPLAVLQSHQPVSDTTLAKKYEDLLAVHEDIKKKLIAKKDFISHSK